MDYLNLNQEELKALIQTKRNYLQMEYMADFSNMDLIRTLEKQINELEEMLDDKN